MTINYRIRIFILAGLFATGAGRYAYSAPLVAGQPKEMGTRAQLKKELSLLNIPVEATAEELAGYLNRTVRSELYNGATRYSGVTALISRNGPIAVSAADNFIYLTLPVSMSLNYGAFGTKGIPLKLKFKVNARITPDWRLAADIHYVGLSELLAEEIGIGPLSVKPRSALEGMSQPLQKALSGVVSRMVNDNFPLKVQAEKAWAAVQKPILLDRNIDAWLKITPLEIMYYPLIAQNNRIRIVLGMSTYNEVVSGNSVPLTARSALPNLKQVSSIGRDFRIALNAELSYREIVRVASPLLLNKEFGTDGKSLILKDFDIYGNGDRLIVKVETTGSLEGIFYLNCKPGYNLETNSFMVEELDFDMQTRDILLRSADWFLHGTIRNIIQEKLNMKLTQKLEQSREMLQKSITRINIHDQIFLSGKISSTKISDVMVQKDRISIQVLTAGETAILFH